jgi:hypothetical protein
MHGQQNIKKIARDILSHVAEYSSLLGYDNVSLIVKDHSAFIFMATQSKQSDPVAEGTMNFQKIRHCLPSDTLYSNTKAHYVFDSQSHVCILNPKK